MKYIPPFGRESEGEAAHYINGNPVEGREGSIPDATSWEHPLRELSFLIKKSKFTPSGDDLTQVALSVRSQGLNYINDDGSANSLSVALDPPLQAYTVGLPLKVRVRETNTGGTTIDAGAGRVPIKKMNGAGTAAGDLPAGGICELVYDGTAFQLINFGGSSGGTITESLIKIPYAVDSSPTPNIIQANFSPPITTLVAGDPLLVKMAMNTNTGSSVIKVNAMAEKPIKANGGDMLLQGDMQKNDVVLLLYDGNSFWIQPNPLISADTTINVPSQYSTPENALLAIRRKTIAQNARVTILMAANAGPINDPTRNIVGGYNPFTINHMNAERITIRGVMKIAGSLTDSLFYHTGNSPANRASDSANNYAMLQSRFGVQIVVPPNAGFTAGIENVGPGNPTVADIFVTGPNYWSGDGVGRWTGVAVRDGRYINCANVSVWGLDNGFYGGGFLSGLNCFSSAAFRNGALATNLANFSFNTSGFYGGALNGVTCNQNSCMGFTSTFTTYNANVGAAASDNSQLTFLSSTSTSNGNVDLAAGPLSYLIVLNNGGFNTSSPAPNIMSAVGALISV
jgi:hypothetical protein